MNDGLFQRCGVLYLDHLAVTTADLPRALADYLALPGARLLRGPAENPVQRVRYAFVQLPGGPAVELLAPLADSPIAGHLARGGGAYHLCYAVADLAAALAAARAEGAAVAAEPAADPAFDGRRVAFLLHPAHGLVELVEAYPAAAAPAPAPIPALAPVGTEAETRLKALLRRLLPALAAGREEEAAIDRTTGWDSVAQIQLIMELEAEFGIDVPAARVATATDYPTLLALLRERGAA